MNSPSSARPSFEAAAEIVDARAKWFTIADRLDLLDVVIGGDRVPAREQVVEQGHVWNTSTPPVERAEFRLLQQHCVIENSLVPG